jgi:hypothetical protein
MQPIQLSPRPSEILTLVAQNHANKLIAYLATPQFSNQPQINTDNPEKNPCESVSICG